MTRVAIYARYSSDAQSEQSIEDQVRVCRARAEREGWTVVEVYADYALSGASASRPQFQQLIRDARAGQFEVILAEALDRLSRDQEHIAGFHKQMSFASVQVVTLSEGAISELHVGLKGTMSALFLKDLAQKTHRGLEGRVRAGGSGGGLSYGYRIRRGLRPDGTPITGEMEIAVEEAAIVRRIFTAFAAGQSPRSIAKVLNAEGVPGPRGGKWTASLLLGGAGRETGLLRNRLYIGERVWNRQRFIKDPSTGKRVARPNPREAWITTSVPDLAIIDAETWDLAQARLSANRRAVLDLSSSAAEPTANRGERLGTVRRPRWPLSGLVRCGVCNGPLTVMGPNGRLGCANYVERGTCTNRRTILRGVLLPRVLVGLKERLLAPELVEEFVRTYVAEVNAANRERGARQAGLEQQRAKLTRQIRNLLELIKDGHGGAAMAAEVRDLERRQEELAQQIAAAGEPEPTPVLHPNLPALYRRRVEALEEALADAVTAMAATEALRALIDAILVFPGERRGEVTVSLRGDLAAFLHAAGEPEAGSGDAKKAANLTVGGLGREVMASLDAGTGFEPVTFRL
ncbi:recombinase family protein [Neoroseomonas oryzicola]|uniref:Recombinase family protein n=1 Tax=Neoroseomonas oryzicola TaxID=535904 RepID=A0A9X9WNM5_9PROT|nr:recombinase family protein [Neoroseomonas oryzicola]MBR0661935.1 recombinase family protein [Neoroseomonas oryzicola]NKE20201.1 recombinase family protein [Neoroseomonas oryzicola]